MIRKIIQRHWHQPNKCLSILLWPLSRLFEMVVRIRWYAFRSGLCQVKRVACPVVVVGNLHVGGVGKTPIVALLAQSLTEQGLSVGVVSRGYGRKNSQPLLVGIDSRAEDVGDEPLMLFQQTKLPIAVSANRVQAAELLLKHYPNTQIIISDDGLQHYRLARDLEIVVFPASDCGQKLDVLPNGLLREPLTRLQTIHALILSGAHLSTDYSSIVSNDLLPETVSLHQAVTCPTDCYALNNINMTRSLSSFIEQQVAVCTAIGEPNRFFQLLRDRGLKLIDTVTLPDHAFLTPSDLPQADIILVTEKDAVKLQKWQLPHVWVLPIRCQLTGLNELIHRIELLC